MFLHGSARACRTTRVWNVTCSLEFCSARSPNITLSLKCTCVWEKTLNGTRRRTRKGSAWFTEGSTFGSESFAAFGPSGFHRAEPTQTNWTESLIVVFWGRARTWSTSSCSGSSPMSVAYRGVALKADRRADPSERDLSVSELLLLTYIHPLSTSSTFLSRLCVSLCIYDKYLCVHTHTQTHCFCCSFLSFKYQKCYFPICNNKINSASLAVFLSS